MDEPQNISRPTALITGATAGIGAAFARALAKDGYHLILVARDTDRLARVAAELPTTCDVITADLTVEEDIVRVEERCRSGLDLLVNNAGFAHPKGFLTTPTRDEIAMSRLHMETVLRLTLNALPSMIENKKGGVINVASIAGFFIGTTYAATKSWVINFSRSVAIEVLPHNVSVTALCPGFTHTEFHDRAHLNMTRLPEYLWLDSDEVVRIALRDWNKGKALSIPGWQYKTIVSLSRLLPMGLTGRVLAGISRRRLRKRPTT